MKIGDFGLATRVDFDGERKKTLCGTPNYIAPEILNKKGHSYEVMLRYYDLPRYTDQSAYKRNTNRKVQL